MYLQREITVVINNNMELAPTPLNLPVVAPELARRLGMILAGLVAVIARRFLREPRLLALILPLWRRLTHVTARFERAVARRVRQQVAPVGQRAARPAGRPPPFRLPMGRGWLVRELGYEAVGFGSQLAHLLADPEMQAVMAAVPAVARMFRPVCRMLGLEAGLLPAPVQADGVTARAAAPARPRVRRSRPPVWRSARPVFDWSARLPETTG